MAEEAAFEIFIPCRLMAFSAVDRMEELGRARREEGGRKFSCEWVPWRAGEREARIYSGRRPQKAITVTTTAETSGKKGRGGKNSTEQHNAKRRPRSIPLLVSLMGWKRRRLFQTNGFPSFAPPLCPLCCLETLTRRRRRTAISLRDKSQRDAAGQRCRMEWMGRGRREGLCMESVSQIERAGARSKAQWGRNQVMGETAGNWNDWAHRPDSADVNPSHTKLKTHSVCVRGSREGRMKRLPRHRWQVGPSPHPRKKVPRVKLEVPFLSAAAATRLFEPSS